MKFMQDYLLMAAIHEGVVNSGLSKQLVILASIVSGVIFFRKCIIPLHKVKECWSFHENIVRCSLIFIDKDPSLGLELLEGY